MHLLTIFAILTFLTTPAIESESTECTEETTNEEEPVLWPNTEATDDKIASDPACYTEKLELITRKCTSLGWTPERDNVPNCYTTKAKTNNVLCPPMFHSIPDDNGEVTKYCYRFTESSSWNYPCYSSGSSLTVNDLSKTHKRKLLTWLNSTESTHVWLPAKRIIPYGPLTWTLPGERWGKKIHFGVENYSSRLSIIHDCLLYDLQKLEIKTENCSLQYPSLCLNDQEHLLPLHCPEGYWASKYGLNNGVCYGLETSEDGASWEQFVNKQCEKPVEILTEFENAIIEELADKSDYDIEDTCWTGLTRSDDTFSWYPNTSISYVNWDAQTDFDNDMFTKGFINERYQWSLADEDTNMHCMACQMDINCKDVDIALQKLTDYIQLTIYSPNNLWKAEHDDIGLQCFSNAYGFTNKIDIDEEPYRRTRVKLKSMGWGCDVEKVTYRFRTVNKEPAEYWCEGHNSKTFSLISSSKLLVPTQKENEHVFVLKMKINEVCKDLSTCNPVWSIEELKLKSLLNAENVRFMRIESVDSDLSAVVIVHISTNLVNACVKNICNIVKTYKFLHEFYKWTFLTLPKYDFIYLKSTMYCMDDSEETLLHWEETLIGEVVAPREFCMRSNGLPVTRECQGSFFYGANWGPVIGSCSEDLKATNRTTYLYNVAKGHTDLATTSSFLVRDLTAVLEDKEDLIPADIYFLALSLKTVLQLSDENSSQVELGDTNNLATAINSLMDVEDEYLNLAQTMNSSNVLLESIDSILCKIAFNASQTVIGDSGVDIAVTPHFLIQISSPDINNITGIALASRNYTNSSSFLDFDIIQLTSNMSIAEILAIPNLEVATWIGQELLSTIQIVNAVNSSRVDNSQLKVIIEIFYNDIVFQETKWSKDTVNSRVISVTIPGYDSDLMNLIPLVYRRIDENASLETACAYWDFQRSFRSYGQWSNSGCYLIESHGSIDVCGCFHLTHFAQLVLGYRGPGDKPGEVIILYYHGRALNAITLVGCSLSLVGVIGIAATAALFPAWRQKPGSKILLQLSGAIALQSLMIISQDSLHEVDSHCIALGAMLHYSVLAAFMWMLLTALLQFARYVRVLGAQRPSRFLVKFSVAGWGLPIIPVAILLIVEPRAYLPPEILGTTENGTEYYARDPAALCYPQGLGLYLTVLLPVACIIVTNLIVFVLVMWSITRGPDGLRRAADPDLVIAQLRLSILLFFLLGLSWIFGFLAASGGTILFSYLFCLTATLQGFILFVYFVLCDPTTRVLWVSLVRDKSRISSMRETSSVGGTTSERR